MIAYFCLKKGRDAFFSARNNCCELFAFDGVYLLYIYYPLLKMSVCALLAAIFSNTSKLLISNNHLFHFFQLSKSGKRSVYLRNVDLNSTGTYRCEVSAEAPSFKSVEAEGDLKVMGKYFPVLLKSDHCMYYISTAWHLEQKILIELSCSRKSHDKGNGAIKKAVRFSHI